MGGFLIEKLNNNSNLPINQPHGVYVYNNQQIMIPLRYAFYSNKIFDFGGGLDAMAYIIPSASQINGQLKIDPSGAVLYLSKKVKNSLLSQIYLLDNSSGEYSSFKLVHSEPSPIMSYLNSHGANVGDFAYINGVQGPIKIWEVDYPSNIKINKEFLRTSGDYAEFDNLNFTY